MFAAADPLYQLRDFSIQFLRRIEKFLRLNLSASCPCHGETRQDPTVPALAGKSLLRDVRFRARSENHSGMERYSLVPRPSLAPVFAVYRIFMALSTISHCYTPLPIDVIEMDKYRNLAQVTQFIFYD